MLYPNRPGPRRRTILIDALVAACLVALAVVAIRAHSQIAGLGVLGHGVSDAGDAVSSGFRAAAAALGSVPLVGGALKHALDSAGAHSGGAVSTAGRRERADADQAAIVIASLTFAVPALVLLQCYLPPRVRQIRQMRAIRQALDPGADPSYRRLVAQRAALTLPYEQVLQHTTDPLADLTAEHYDALIRAAAAHAGIAA